MPSPGNQPAGPETGPESLLGKLRTATREKHERLEQAMGRIAPLHTLEGYRQLLLSMYELHRNFGASADRAAESLGLPPSSHAHLRALEEDLSSLLDSWQPAADQDATPPTPDAAADLGVLYVLEGSALGAQVLLRTVTDEHGTKAPTAYLRSVSEAAPARWPLVVQHLKRETAPSPHTVSRAIQVFDHLLRRAEATG